MIVYILAFNNPAIDEWLIEGVFYDRASALILITGEEEDYERMSDTEEFFETSNGEWVITEWGVQ